MVDLLGPGAHGAARAVTTRPASTPANTFGAPDTFFKDCSAPLAGDGTEIKAAWLTALAQQMRTCIRNAGVAEDNTDDAMLWKALGVAAKSKQSEVFTPGRILSSTSFVAGTEYVVATLPDITGATSLLIYGSFQAVMPSALQADTALKIRVTRVSDSAVIDEAPQAGTVVGSSYVGDSRAVGAYSSVVGLSPSATYRVQLIATANGSSTSLQYFNPYLTANY